MRLSILINTSDPTVNHDYAVLWLDTISRAWTSQDRRGVELPSSGDMREDGHIMSLCACGSEQPLVTLYGVRIDRHGNMTSAQGQATWISHSRPDGVAGYWRLQAVERDGSHSPTPARR
ncbi:DUF3564 family protein [Paraburkholderia sp. Tr-20389]|uniref:DUF3564 family protein n=1 Tax=Paraburkholderia sp. Tr-20389 TaxID=2703903 RepID=UPI00197EFF79|nr:DUF3564 family protein [Paraburkholderia sp. Tr-20389]MBN3758126.1 DUF3564 family protein [Paraburkholderia sp. Tr-20389]